MTTRIAVVLLCAFVARAPDPPPQAPAAARIAAELASHVPGASITVASRGRIVWRHAVGHADIEARRPVTDDTTFAVYSVAKSWTAALGARLVAEGRLRPNTSITSYIKIALPGAEGVTAMLLATHRSGVRHYRDTAEAEMPGGCATVAEALPRFVDDPLIFEPASSRAYSSYGFVLLSAVIEAAGGAPFDALMAREVFRPFDMRGVTLARLPREGNAATSYRSDADGWTPAGEHDLSCKWGAGGYRATSADLVRFYVGLMREGYLPAELRDLVLSADAGGRIAQAGSGVAGASRVVADVQAGTIVAIAANGVDSADALAAAADALLELWR